MSNSIINEYCSYCNSSSSNENTVLVEKSQKSIVVHNRRCLGNDTIKPCRHRSFRRITPTVNELEELKHTTFN